MNSGHGSLSVRHSATAIPESLHTLLAETSRTFALAIPLLPRETRDDVTIAYLLLRIADTIEDSPHIGRVEKIAQLTRFVEQLGSPERVNGGTSLLPVPSPCSTYLEFSTPPSDHPHEIDLLSQSSLVIDFAQSRPEAVSRPLLRYVKQSAKGMARFVECGTDGSVQLCSLDEVREYCYCVAGLVGELLTEVFVARDENLAPFHSALQEHARWFGEGLQLVNILKDADDDSAEGRRFIPSDADRQSLFDLARSDLLRATEYVEILRSAQAHPGVVAFTELPLQLAWRTLDCVESSGPGSKIPRDEVLQLLSKYQDVTNTISDSNNTPK